MSLTVCLLWVQGCGVGSSSERTRTAITAALKKKLKDIVGDFSALRLKLQLEYRSALLHTRPHYNRTRLLAGCPAP